MSLNNSQINSILKEYDAKQFRNQDELNKRIKEVYIKVPEIRKIDEELVEGSASFAKNMLLHKEVNIDIIKKRNTELSNKKRKLLVDAGFPEDYMQMHYHCDKCKDTGYIDNNRCSCFRQAAISLLYSQALINTALYSQNFDTFDYSLYSDKVKDPVLNVTPLENIRLIVDTCNRFIEEISLPPDKRELKNLLILGSTGVGKTFLSNCIAKAALDSECSVVYITAGELFDVLENNSFRKDSYDDAPDARIENINQCDLLIIDDLGTEFSNRFTNAKLYSCVNDRLIRNKPMVISTNLNFKDFQMTYSERIYSRFIGEFVPLRIIGDDIRIKKC